MRRRRLVLLSCFALTAALAPACRPEPISLEGRPRHVVLVLLESVRADHVGAYGYPRPTTPRLDALAAGGVLFERAYAASSAHAQALAALWTGRLPSSGGSTGLAAAPHPSLATLPRLFLRAGFRTALASNQPALRQRGFTRGCDELEIDSEPGRWSGDQVTERALDLADGARGQPLFLIVDYADACEPHLPPPSFRERIGVPAPEAQLTLPELRARAGALPEGFEQTPGFGDLVARYDSEIAHADACLGELVDGLRERGLLDETLLVVTSSHGVELLEHGYVGSGWTLYEEVLRVPLVLFAPGHLFSARVDGPVSLVDLLPSLARVLSLDTEVSETDGVALLAPAPQGLALEPRAGCVIAEVVLPELSVMRTVIEDRWKIVEAVEAVPPDERAERLAGYGARAAAVPSTDAFAPVLRREHYDLASDPRETLALDVPTGIELERLRAALEHYVERCRTNGLRPITAARAPGASDEPDPRAVLRQIGYL